MPLPTYVKSGETARLIPVVADTSKEVRAASMLLAVLSAVPAFRNTMLATIGQKTGSRASLECFTEVVLQNDTPGATCRPDGLLVLESGRGRSWSCLIEAKIGKSELTEAQVERYVALAKLNRIDSILTISNQFVASPTHSPLRLSKSTLKGITTYHWSWMFVLTQAQLVLNEPDFDNNSQKYILREFVRHLAHPSAGVSQFDRMNSEWKEVVARVQSGALLNKHEPAVEASVASWHQEARDLCLLLSRKVNALVQLALPRRHKEDQELRLRDDCEQLVRDHKLNCILSVPNAAAPINVTADLLRRTLNVSMTLVAPKDKQRGSARINWLLRQLAGSNADNIQVSALWPGRTAPTQVPLTVLRETPEALEAENHSLAPVAFDVILVRDLAGKFGGAKTFIEHVEDAVPLFYKDVGERLRAYIPPPPKITSTGAPREYSSIASPEASQEQLTDDDLEVIERTEPPAPNHKESDPCPPSNRAIPIEQIDPESPNALDSPEGSPPEGTIPQNN